MDSLPQVVVGGGSYGLYGPWKFKGSIHADPTQFWLTLMEEGRVIWQI